MSQEDKLWRKYEKEIFNILKDTFEDCHFEFDDLIFGKFSKVDRQIDIAIRGKIGGSEVLGIIDCKYFGKKIDVKIIEAFLGMIEDVKANFGIIITNQGFSKAAKNRATLKNLKLDIIKFNELEKIQLTYDYFVNQRIKSIELSKFEFNRRGKQNTGYFDAEKSSYRKRIVIFKENYVNSETYVYKKMVESAARWFRDFSELEVVTLKIPHIIKDINFDKVLEKRLYKVTLKRGEIENYFSVNLLELKQDIALWRSNYFE